MFQRYGKTFSKPAVQVRDEDVYDEYNPQGFTYGESVTGQMVEEDLVLNRFPNFDLEIDTLKSLNTSGFTYLNLNHEMYPLKYENWDRPQLGLFKDSIRSQVFLNKIQSGIFTKNNFRSYRQILEGKKLLGTR